MLKFGTFSIIFWTAVCLAIAFWWLDKLNAVQLALFALFWLAGTVTIAHNKGKNDEERAEVASVLESARFVRKQRGPLAQATAFFSDKKDAWEGTWRNRDFVISVVAQEGYVEQHSLRIKKTGYGLMLATQNRSGVRNEINFDNKNQMESNNLSEIYGRLEVLGMFRALDLRLVGQWRYFYITDREAVFTLSPALVNEHNLRESLDIVCETLERLGK